jgi:hypothetical protein
MVVRAPADNPVVTTQRPDFFIGERVEAKMIVTYTGNPDNVNWSMRFEWEDPMGVPIFNETMNMTVYPAPTDRYGAAFSNWTSDMTGVGFTVRGVHISEAKFSEAKFNVSTYSEIAVVESLSISTSRLREQHGRQGYYDNGLPGQRHQIGECIIRMEVSKRYKSIF